MTLLKKRLSQDIASSTPTQAKKIKTFVPKASISGSLGMAAQLAYMSDEKIYKRLMDCMARKQQLCQEQTLLQKEHEEERQRMVEAARRRQFVSTTTSTIASVFATAKAKADARSPKSLAAARSTATATVSTSPPSYKEATLRSLVTSVSKAGIASSNGGVAPSIVTPSSILVPHEASSMRSSSSTSSSGRYQEVDAIPSVSALPPLPFEKTDQRRQHYKPAGVPAPVVFKVQQEGANPLDMLSSVSSRIANKVEQRQQAQRLRSAAAATTGPFRRRSSASPNELQSPRKSAVSPTIPQARASRSSSIVSSTSVSSSGTDSQEDPNYAGERNSTGQRHGRGIMAYTNGCRYAGFFQNNKRNGYGKCWYPNNLGTYSGDWIDNKKSGKGTMTYANGDVYKGEWANDLPNGIGKLIMKGGKEIYEGGFVNERKCGRGRLIHADGTVYKGLWEDGMKHGEGMWMFENGDIERKIYFRGTML